VRHYLEKTHHEKGLMEWLKLQALSSNYSTSKKKKTKQTKKKIYTKIDTLE
jgi:hypothetical protein